MDPVIQPKILLRGRTWLHCLAHNLIRAGWEANYIAGLRSMVDDGMLDRVRAHVARNGADVEAWRFRLARLEDPWL